jgi:hypothetical protein
MLALLAWLMLAPGPSPWPAMETAAEVKTLSGVSRTGALMGISSRGVELKSKEGATQTIPLEEVLAIELAPPAREGEPAADKAYALVRLIDGSQLCAEQVGFAADNLTLKLRGGQEFQIPQGSVATLLLNAHDAKNVAEFQAALANATKSDVVRLVSRQDPNVSNVFEGVVGVADAQGQTLRFTPEGSDPVELAISRLRSIAFVRPGSQPQARLGALVDRHRNFFALSQVEVGAASLKFQTPTGLTLETPLADVVRIDLSQGKLVYLSDLEPARIETEHLVYVPPASARYGRDKSLKGTPLRVGRKTFAKGLSLHAKTILEYDVAGYNFFRCTLGLDDSVTRVGSAAVRIEGDGKELFTQTVSLADARPREVELKITGVRRLRLMVDYGDNLDLGDHVDFADARIMK